MSRTIVTLRLYLYILFSMSFQSVVFGFADSQILFGVFLIISHQILIILFVYAIHVLYACCSPFESLAHVSMPKHCGFGIHPIVINFLCTVFLCVFRQLDGICLSSKSFILHINSASFTLSLPHIFFCGI